LITAAGIVARSSGASLTVGAVITVISTDVAGRQITIIADLTATRWASDLTATRYSADLTSTRYGSDLNEQ
jgi:hypothetical protein